MLNVPANYLIGYRNIFNDWCLRDVESESTKKYIIIYFINLNFKWLIGAFQMWQCQIEIGVLIKHEIS